MPCWRRRRAGHWRSRRHEREAIAPRDRPGSPLNYDAWLAPGGYLRRAGRRLEEQLYDHVRIRGSRVQFGPNGVDVEIGGRSAVGVLECVTFGDLRKPPPIASALMDPGAAKRLARGLARNYPMRAERQEFGRVFRSVKRFATTMPYGRGCCLIGRRGLAPRVRDALADAERSVHGRVVLRRADLTGFVGGGPGYWQVRVHFGEDPTSFCMTSDSIATPYGLRHKIETHGWSDVVGLAGAMLGARRHTACMTQTTAPGRAGCLWEILDAFARFHRNVGVLRGLVDCLGRLDIVGRSPTL